MGSEEEAGGEEGVHVLGGGAVGELARVLADAGLPVVGFEHGVGGSGWGWGWGEVEEVGEGGGDYGVHYCGAGECEVCHSRAH